MRRKRRTPKATQDLREKINKLVQEGFSYEEISRILKVKSKQLVAYHFRKYRLFIIKNKPKEDLTD